MFFKHILFGHEEDHEKDFIECSVCNHVVNRPGLIDEDCQFFRWVKRVEKYRTRLPDWKVSYYIARKEPTVDGQERLLKQTRMHY